MQAMHAVPPQPDSLPVLEERAEILRHEAVNGEYRLMQVAAPDQAQRARAGQFFHLLCPQDDVLKPFFRRPMSIYAIDAEGGRISFLYKITGTGTKALAKLGIGERLDMLGPLGIGFSLPPRHRDRAQDPDRDPRPGCRPRHPRPAGGPRPQRGPRRHRDPERAQPPIS